MKYMLDTNFCIYVIKSKPEKVFKNLQTITGTDIGFALFFGWFINKSD